MAWSVLLFYYTVRYAQAANVPRVYTPPIPNSGKAVSSHQVTNAGRLAMHDPTWPEGRTNL
eukprot:3369562-Prymnesium_polylepis.1